jgi:Holliday junction resolvase-like predicted endonuclease
LEKNYRVPFGEIDIVARKKWKLLNHDKTIHFVEVKTIMAIAGFFPENKFNRQKRFKVTSLCQLWLQKTKLPLNWPHQVDVIGVTINPDTQEPRVYCIENAVAEK